VTPPEFGVTPIQLFPGLVPSPRSGDLVPQPDGGEPQLVEDNDFRISRNDTNKDNDANNCGDKYGDVHVNLLLPLLYHT